MDHTLAWIAILALVSVQFAIAADPANNTTNTTNTSGSGSWIPDINLPINTSGLNGEGIINATKTGISEVDSFTQTLINLSPFLLLILGIVIFMLAGFAKIIAIILIAVAVIRIVMMLFGI